MFGALARKFFGSANDRRIRVFEPNVQAINALEPELQKLTDEQLRERFSLTEREIGVARLVAAGLSNQELADKLGVSFYTARNHVERLLGKLGAGNRARVGAMLRGE